MTRNKDNNLKAFESGGRLSVRLFVSILLFSTLITVILTAAQLYFDFQRDRSNIDVLVQQVGEAHRGGLENSLWSLDKEGTQIMAQGILSIPDIAYVEIQENSNVWVSSGSKPTNNFVELQYPLNNPTKSAANPVQIGQFTVVASLERVYQGLYDRSATLLITNALETIIVAGFILVIVNWLITRHLRRTSLYLSRYDLHDPTPLNVDRKVPFGQGKDEIDLLVSGINTMRVNLLQAFQDQKSAELELRSVSAWQRAALDAADYSVVSTDVDGVIATFNKKAETMLGYTADEMIGKQTPAIIHDLDEVVDYAQVLSKEFGEEIKPGFEVFVRKAMDDVIDEREWTYIAKDGTRIPVLLSVTNIKSEANELIGFLGIATDLTQQLAMQATLEKSEVLYQSLFNNAGDAIVLLSDQGVLIDCNPAALELYEYPEEAFLGKEISDLSPEIQPNGKKSSNYGEEVSRKALQGRQQIFEWMHEKRDGTPFEVEVSLSRIDIEEVPYLQAIIRDITERKQLEKDLAFQAGHDSLTNMANRKTLHENFPQHLREAEKPGWGLVIMLLDLDRFKEINDTLGHHFGDLVLNQVGPRLQQQCTEKTATIARLGGDEFALTIASKLSLDELTQMAESIVNALRQPFNAGGINVTVGASLGMAIYPQHGKTSHELLRAADVAMYDAKRKSAGVVIYDEVIDAYSATRLQIASDLNKAVAHKELLLHYQPKIDVATKAITGFEALVRWDHPERGLLYPDHFIDLVEMSEIIHPFTKQVIEMAMSDKKHLMAKGFDYPIAINLSARNLIDDSYLVWIETELERNNLPSSAIEIELTESAVMQEPEVAINLLEKTSARGVNIAIDDFGTGHSSLSYLKNLPVTSVKVDKSFVINMIADKQYLSIVQTTIALAKDLELRVIAEGVEDDSALDMLVEMQCDEAQGYGICRPLPLAEIVDWTERWQSNLRDSN